MKIGVGEPRHPARILVVRERPRRPLGTDVEIEPPHGERAEEGAGEGRDGGRAPWRLAERGAGDEDRFAQCDDDEEAAALREMMALYVPDTRIARAETGQPEGDGGAQVQDEERRAP